MLRFTELGSVIAVALAVVSVQPARGAPQTPDLAIDKIFAQFTPSTPGCAIGVERAGHPAIIRAYGSADLEHGVPNTVDTIFEAGSVSKQFTAATVLLLVQDGKLSLGDNVRKFIPELPDYGQPITIGELLGHTSGLRDWRSIEVFAGWPPGDRLYGLADALRVATRQATLNYPPGTAWSYTNTGYDLLAIIVQRVSGKSLADLSRERLFVPLGMAHSSWRDDFRRIVSGRAIAYDPVAGGYHEDMPFENGYGPGGLLTTVGDLLIWNRA